MEGPGVRYLGSLAQHGPEWYQAAGYDYLVASHFWTVFVTPDLYTPQVATYQRLFEFPLARAMEGPVQYMWDPIKEIRIHRVPVPERYTLSMAEGDAPWLTEGFYPPEAVDGRQARWTAGRAVLELRLRAGAQYSVRLTGASPRPAGVEPARTVLLVEGSEAAEHAWSADEREWATRIAVPTGPEPTRRVRLTLETNTWCPSDVVGTEDARDLGVLLESIVIEELETR